MADNAFPFTINGDATEQLTGELGSQFEWMCETFSGTTDVKIQVGEQVTINRVAISKSKVDVFTDFDAPKLQNRIELEQRRIAEEQENANWDEYFDEVYYIPSRSIQESSGNWPAFDRHILSKNPDGERFFVSHRWKTPGHPDPEGQHLALVRRHARQHPDAYYWFDFTCLPQSRNAEDRELFAKTLPQIAHIQSNASTLVILAPDYFQRLWCYTEYYTGLLFTQAVTAHGQAEVPKSLDYLGLSGFDRESIADRHSSMMYDAQRLDEPDWERLRVSNVSDVPAIKYNFRWLSNILKFVFLDRFHDLRWSLPGAATLSGLHFNQSVFFLDYQSSLEHIMLLFIQHGGNPELIFRQNSLLWLARRFSWSKEPDRFDFDGIQLSPFLVPSKSMLAWVAFLIGLIKIEDRNRGQVVHFRENWAKIILMSLFH